MIFYGGELDGLSLNANDKTLSWPIRIVFEMLIDDGQPAVGADEIPTGIMKTREIRYSIINSGEEPDGDAFAQYDYVDAEDFERDLNSYSDDSTDPFHPDNV